MVLTYLTIRHYNPEDHIRNLHHREKFTSRILVESQPDSVTLKVSVFTLFFALFQQYCYDFGDSSAGRQGSRQKSQCTMHFKQIMASSCVINLWGVLQTCAQRFECICASFYFTGVGSKRLKVSLLLQSVLVENCVFIRNVRF